MQALMGFVVGDRVVFGMVVGPVLGARLQVITKLILGCATIEPPKLHIHHLVPMVDNSFVGDSCSCTFWLGPTHGNEGLAVGNHFSCSDE
jgi:hypothetical protein